MGKHLLILGIMVAVLAAIDQAPSPNFLERVDPDTGKSIEPTVLVLHYTAQPLARVKEIFSLANVQTPVSSHYTVDEDGSIYQHVNETKAARHAGVSYWRGLEGADATQKKLNCHSIGIEQINLGYRDKAHKPAGTRVQGSDKEWYPYDPRLIKSTIALCKEILARNKGITPRNIVAHSDIAPARKHDPGPLFPWKKLAHEGIGVWPRLEKVRPLTCLPRSTYNDEQKRTDWLIKHLQIWGYRKPGSDATAQDIISAFQMHFRPTCIDGKADKETVDILRALLCEHVVVPGKRCACSEA